MNFKRKIVFSLIAMVLLGASAWFFFAPHKPQTLREFFGTPEYESIDIRKPLDQQRSIVEIAGRVFSIPKVYIQTDLRGKRNQDNGVNLLYVMPDITSMVDFKDREAYDQALHDSRMASMLVKNANLEVPIVATVQNRKKNKLLGQYEGNHYGLEKYIDIGTEKRKNLLFDDTYLELDKEGQVISFISCDREEKVPYPGCSHIFLNKGLYYNISYNKKNFLPTWQEHRRKAIAFIDSFEIK